MEVGENMKKCQYCNKKFEPKNNRQKYCEGPHIRICPICNKEYIEKNNWQLQFPPHACSYKCRGILQSQTKANKPKKKRKLIKLLEDNPQYIDKFESASILNRGKLIPKLEKLLQDNNIQYMLPIHIEDERYDIWLKASNTVLFVAEFSEDVNHNRNKVNLAEAKGYNCFIIYPWDDLTKIVQQFKPKVKVDLNKCSLFRLNRKPSNEFLDNYHLQNSCRNQLSFWGIVRENEILQIITFGKPRFSKNYSIEMMRYCTKPGIKIDGSYMNLFYGAQALQYLQNVVGYEQIGRLPEFNFDQLGFNLQKTTPPQEIWSKENKHITASLLRARGYDQLFGTNYGKGVSNGMLMLQTDWLPVFDCGQKVFVYE